MIPMLPLSRLAGLLGAALLLGVTALPQAAVAQTPAAKATPSGTGAGSTTPVKKPAAKPVAKKAAPAPEPEPVVSAADEKQLLAAKEVMLGNSGCEFGQKIHLDESVRYPGYMDLSFNNRKYVMKPVMSSTGALRLEDVRAETLLIQIGNKTMLMNQKTGQRMVDNCIHPKHETVAASGGGSMLGEPSAK